VEFARLTDDIASTSKLYSVKPTNATEYHRNLKVQDDQTLKFKTHIRRVVAKAREQR